MTLIGRGDKPRDRCHSANYHTNLNGNAVKCRQHCTENAIKLSTTLGFVFWPWMQSTVFSKCLLYSVQLIWFAKMIWCVCVAACMQMKAMSRNTAPHTASRRARRVTGRFTPFVSSPLHLFNVSCLFCLFCLKPEHHCLDILTIFQHGVCGARGAVFRDTPDESHAKNTRNFILLRWFV